MQLTWDIIRRRTGYQVLKLLDCDYLENLPTANIKSCLQVTFEGIIGSSYTGDVAIDEVKITQGSCQGE